MDSEHNNNLGHGVNVDVGTDQVDSSLGTSPMTGFNPSQASTPPPTNLSKPKKSPIKVIIIILVAVVLLGASIVAAYTVGTRKNKTAVVTVAPPQSINLPPEAIVTSECTTGRGKQYIIPKDIPAGPIYDVKNNKVIAIEYVLGIQALMTNSDTFSSTLLQLTKNYPVDHFTIVPVQPKAGDADQYMHLIMFVVSKDEANSITCDASANAESSTTPSSTSTTHTN